MLIFSIAHGGRAEYVCNQQFGMFPILKFQLSRRVVLQILRAGVTLCANVSKIGNGPPYVRLVLKVVANQVSIRSKDIIFRCSRTLRRRTPRSPRSPLRTTATTTAATTNLAMGCAGARGAAPPHGYSEVWGEVLFRDKQKHRTISKIHFFEHEQIGWRLDRVPGRYVHTDLHTKDLWGVSRV